MSGPAELLAAANDRRAAEAAERNARTARELLALPLPPRARAVVEARALNPAASWGEVAAIAGVTKGVATALWQRALAKARRSA